MTEENKESTPAGTEEGTQGGAGSEGGGSEEFNAEQAKAKIAKVNSEAANLRKRLKEAEDNLKAVSDKDKSAEEKEAEKVRTLEGRATTAESQVARLTVALKKGLTLSQAKRLVGETEEELEADADELLETFGKPEERKAPAGKPKEKLKGGGSPSEEPQETDPAKLAARIRRR